ncbi:tyrosine-type recombinase/integrase [Patiriisocius hiemis]|uniref:Site-specific integrase n=1 Tax=Patiriisocius hiemis TaxID=3075604 RepID=A0ABU2YEP7_9FLAO|nr:site-specific integrase [Constantimarinum sp. W242]MDT0556217.1 site-specific integrase [Constantimarinum sp. W242]
MSIIYDFVTLENQIEHDLEHTLEHKKQFSTPKIYSAKGDLSKRWYVYFSFRNPATGKLQRMKNIYGIANKFDTREDRMTVLTCYRINLIRLLKKGYSPFEDNSELHTNLSSCNEQRRRLQSIQKGNEEEIPYSSYFDGTETPKDHAGLDTNLASCNEQPDRLQPESNVDDESSIEEIPTSIKNSTVVATDISSTVATVKATSATSENPEIVGGEDKSQINTPKKTPPIATAQPTSVATGNTTPKLKEEMAFALSLKKQVISPRTLRDYTSSANTFIEWLKIHKSELQQASDINRMTCIAYLNSIASRSSARNRNNHKVNLSSLFEVLKENEVVTENYFKKISKLKSIPKRNRRYTLEEQERIFKYLETKDPVLLLYIKCISYAFLRPIEVCRLKVKDIDLNNKTLHFQAKNKAHKIKMIPQLLLDDLGDISHLKKENVLFTPEGLGKEWVATVESRRDYFSKRFKKVVKDTFDFDENYGLYSFRHTYVTKLYRQLIKEHAPYAAKSKLMLITGHTTMTALEKYLRQIDAELPEDYSDML